MKEKGEAGPVTDLAELSKTMKCPTEEQKNIDTGFLVAPKIVDI